MIAGPGSVMPRPDGKETVFSSRKPQILGVLGNESAPTAIYTRVFITVRIKEI